MEPNKEEEKSALDSLEQKLYDPEEKMETITPHRVRDIREKELPTSWTQAAPVAAAASREGLSFGAKFLIAALLVLVGVLSFAAWRVLSSRNMISEKNIDLQLNIDPYIEGGEVTKLAVGLVNSNEVALEEATLTVMYKQGAGAQDEQEKIQVKKDIGTLVPGDFKRYEFDVVLYGSEAEARDISVRLEYKTPVSNARFSKTALTQVVLKSPPVSVEISGPDTLSVGQVGTFEISVKNNTSTTTTPSVLLLTLPTNFAIEELSPKPSTRGNAWQVAPLNPGQTFTVTLTGSLSGSQGEVSTLKALIGSVGEALASVGITYSSQVFDVSLRSSPLVVSLALDNGRGSGDSLMYGDTSTITVAYKNTTTDTIRDASIILSVSGTAALVKDIRTESGYYNSAAGTITWDRGNVPALAELGPGAEGLFYVTIPIVTKGSNAPKLTLSLNGKGTIKESNDVVATVLKSFVVQGGASIAAQTQYKNSPFQNIGPIPPEPNVDTTYTLHMTVSAQNAIQNVKVSFVLPSYVTWRNVGGSGVTYDAKTRTVVWNVGALGAGKSVSNDIGISVRPSQIHVNNMPAVTSGIVLDADEVESKAHIRTTLSGLTTFISGEAWNVNPSVVVDR